MLVESKNAITSGKLLLLKGVNNGIPQMISVGEASTGIRNFINNERISLEEKLLEKERAIVADKEKSHGRKRSKKEIRDINTTQQRERDRINSQIEKLKFENNSPLVIDLNKKGRVIGCFVALDHGDLQWISFVKKNKDLLRIGEKGRGLVYKALMFRLGAQQGEPGAQQKYFDLIREEIGERRDLDPFLRKITDKYGMEKS